MQFDTLCVRGANTPDPSTRAIGTPIARTSAFLFESTEQAANLFALKELGNIYSRLTNPTVDALERRLALLEGAPEMGGLAHSSGMAAIFNTIVTLASAGDNIIAPTTLYGGTFTAFDQSLSKLGIQTKWIKSSSPEDFERKIDAKTRAIYCETLTNPSLEIADIAQIADIAHAHNIPLIVDATFTPPYLLRPIEHGADIVIHSLTKWIGGHGTGIGGIVIDSGRFSWNSGNHPLFDEADTSYHGLRWGHDLPEALSPLAFILRMRTVSLRNAGNCLSPDNAWMFLQGVETLSLRMDRHCSNALAIALFLKNHPAVSSVRYPGLCDDPQYAANLHYLKGKGGACLVFELKGGEASGKQLIESLRYFDHVANVGDVKSIITHPASTTHSQLSSEEQLACGITPGLIRLSIGIEDKDDLIEDLHQALEGVTN